MYRHHPQIALARKLVADGAIGELAVLRAALTVSVEPGDIRRSVAMGGGALGDLGCYCVSAARLFAGRPERVWAERVDDGPGGVDLRMAATLRMAGGVLAHFDVGLDLPRRDELELVGTAGRLVVPDPWLCRGGAVELTRDLGDGRTERVPVDPAGAHALSGEEADAYRIEFDSVSAGILDGLPPSFGPQDILDQAEALAAIERASRVGT